MFGGSLFVFDLSNKLEAELKDSKQDPPISCMHLDDQTGYIWTGHKNGNVRCGGCVGGGKLLMTSGQCDASRCFGHMCGQQQGSFA
jgi:hypothetical protein